MNCTDKEWKHCQEEKRGCKGCYHDKEEIERLIEELTKVRPELLDEEGQKLFNTIMRVIDERDMLREENKELKRRG